MQPLERIKRQVATIEARLRDKRMSMATMGEQTMKMLMEVTRTLEAIERQAP